jgi:hypothetical protein
MSVPCCTKVTNLFTNNLKKRTSERRSHNSIYNNTVRLWASCLCQCLSCAGITDRNKDNFCIISIFHTVTQSPVMNATLHRVGFSLAYVAGSFSFSSRGRAFCRLPLAAWQAHRRHLHCRHRSLVQRHLQAGVLAVTASPQISRKNCLFSRALSYAAQGYTAQSSPANMGQRGAA